MLITDFNIIMHTFYCYNHMYIKRYGIVFYFLSNIWDYILEPNNSMLTWVTRGPLSEYK